MTQWIQVDIRTTTEGIEPVAAVLLDMGLSYAVQDAADFQRFLDGKEGRWDYIDESVLELRDAPTTVTVYLSDGKQGVDQLAHLTRELDRLQFMANEGEWGALTYTLTGVEEEQWATAWKQYYKPISISPRLTICPEWIAYQPQPEETVVLMDPGMAFGTGAHESTRLCLELLDEVSRGGEHVLDIGSGSGILSIAALKLGAERALGIDIDEVAMESARQNAQLNDVAHQTFYRQGNFLQGVEGTYDIVFANIVADAIMHLAPDLPEVLAPGGVFIASGIIDERRDEVASALRKNRLAIVGEKQERGWVAFQCKVKDDLHA